MLRNQDVWLHLVLMDKLGQPVPAAAFNFALHDALDEYCDLSPEAAAAAIFHRFALPSAR